MADVIANELRFIRASEIPEPIVRTVWGPWMLSRDRYPSIHLVINNQEWYWIDLRKIHDSASMLDWIFQVHNKVWCTPEIDTGLLEAFNEIFRPQGTLCSFGQSTVLEKDYLHNEFKARDKTGKRLRWK